MDNRRRSRIKELLQLTAFVVAALLLRTTAFAAYEIPTSSMVPTLAVGDRVFVNKLAYGLRIPLTSTRLFSRLPSRGDIVVFDDPRGGPTPLIKRVIGLPGDAVEIDRRQVRVNHRLIATDIGPTRGPCAGPPIEAIGSCLHDQESLNGHLHRTQYFEGLPRGPATRVTVPPDRLFVMGDNRDNSSDSRTWGFVPRAALIGRAERLFFSWKPGSGPRWGRTFKGLR